MNTDRSSLGDRLRAYNRNTSQKPAVLKSSRHFSEERMLFRVHPGSAEDLTLDAMIAVDFSRDLACENLMFFDLESTGLGSGEQVYPFLIGYARAAASGTELVTLFADSPAGEEEVLRAFIAAAEGKTLVSFNGKSFDLPLIMRRASKYGIRHKLQTPDHIDLYHVIRRIYPEKPARLSDAETRLLGFTRAGDLGGAEVAQGYFELLRFGDTVLREKILKHNAWDVLTLASLMKKVSAAFLQAREGKASWAYKIHRDRSADKARQKELLLRETRADARDFFALGQIFRSEKNFRQSARHFLSAYRMGYPLALADAVRQLSKLGKKALATRLARYGLAREDERVQRHLQRYL